MPLLFWEILNRLRPCWDNTILENVVDRIFLMVSLIVILVSGAALVTVTRNANLGHPQRVGALAEGNGVERREVRSLEWQRLKKGAAVYLGDALRTHKERVTISLNNRKRIDLLPDSMVVLEDLTPTKIEVSVYSGDYLQSPDVIVKTVSSVAEVKRALSPVLAIPLSH